MSTHSKFPIKVTRVFTPSTTKTPKTGVGTEGVWPGGAHKSQQVHPWDIGRTNKTPFFLSLSFTLFARVTR
jgi:hypothetical protein